eukprot:7335780-Pyramimonas_sp.AAC.1
MSRAGAPWGARIQRMSQAKCLFSRPARRNSEDVSRVPRPARRNSEDLAGCLERNACPQHVP